MRQKLAAVARAHFLSVFYAHSADIGSLVSATCGLIRSSSREEEAKRYFDRGLERVQEWYGTLPSPGDEERAERAIFAYRLIDAYADALSLTRPQEAREINVAAFQELRKALGYGVQEITQD